MSLTRIVLWRTRKPRKGIDKFSDGFDEGGLAQSHDACAVDYVYYYVHHGVLNLPVETLAAVELPGLPPLDLADMPSYIYVLGSYPAYFQLLLSKFVNVEKADFVLVNTFYALEAELFTFFNHTFFVKTVGCSIFLRQFDSQEIERIHPFDSPKPFRWKSYAVELLKMDGYEWSAPFIVDTEGTMFILLRSESKLDQMNLRVEVRSATKSSRYEVIFRPNFFSSSYRATMDAIDEIVQLICCLCESTLALESDVTRRSSPVEIPQYAEICNLVNFSVGTHMLY
ncbi:hypothetical protein OROMI_019991 [Orobanche minor]